MYQVSSTPRVADSQGMFTGTNEYDLHMYHERLRVDRIKARRSQGQKTRHARERLYGKGSHEITVRRIPGWEPKA